MTPSTPAKLLKAAGLVTAGLASIPAIVRAAQRPTWVHLAWVVPVVVFVAAFLHAFGEAVPKWSRRVALVVECAAALAFTALARGGFAVGLAVVVAGQAPFLVGPKGVFALVTAQTAVLAVIFGWGTGVMRGLVGSSANLCLEIFAVGVAYLALREGKAREELARANAELLAAREAFAGVTRTEERLRIARELHDTMGHRLTALHLQLEVAKNTAGDKHAQAVETSSEISKSLLREVRDVVSAMREETPIDLEQALSRLIAAVPRPRISLVIDPGIRDLNAAGTHAIFRFVQEAVTNAARHAEAETLVVEVTLAGNAVRATARDDGKGAKEMREGNGLRGLRERLEVLGGTLDVEARDGHGTEIRACVPLNARPA